MNDTLQGTIIGGAIALASQFLSHFLSLREDKVKRQRDEEKELKEELSGRNEKPRINRIMQEIHKVQQMQDRLMQQMNALEQRMIAAPRSSEGKVQSFAVVEKVEGGKAKAARAAAEKLKESDH